MKLKEVPQSWKIPKATYQGYLSCEEEMLWLAQMPGDLCSNLLGCSFHESFIAHAGMGSSVRQQYFCHPSLYSYNPSRLTGSLS